MDKFLSRFDEADVQARVEVARSTRHHRTGKVYHVDVNIDLPKKVIRAEDEGTDIRAAIDSVKNKLQREIVKYIEPRVRSKSAE